MWKHYDSLNLEQTASQQTRRRFSVTSDILAFQECSLQYEAFAVHRYEPALAVQRFYGTIVHQVLDRAHLYYRGRLGAPQGSMPSDSDIESYYLEAENALKARRIRAVQNVRDQALRVVQRFNEIEGPSLYPRVIDTECRIQATQDKYILEGIVDVLATSPNDGLEIWDYKGARRPSMGTPEYQRYVFQLQVYADLYRQKTGITPAKAVLYFLNELAPDPAPTQRPVSAMLEVELSSESVKKALQSFDNTVNTITHCRSTGQWPAPQEPPRQATCDECDLRWNCNAARKLGRNYQMRYP